MLLIIGIACAGIGAYAAIRTAVAGESPAAIIWVTCAATIVAWIAALWVAHWYAQRQSAAILAELKKAIPVAPPGTANIDDVVDATANSLAKLIDQAAKDKGQLLTIISSMNEGLVAVDHLQRVLLANEAAEVLLGIKMPDAQGKPIWEQVAVEGVAHAAAEVMLTGQPKTFAAG